jgi:hypothetical protein
MINVLYTSTHSCFAGGLGVGIEGDDDDEQLSQDQVLVFLFPRTSPAVLLRVVLRGLRAASNDAVLLEFGSVVAADNDHSSAASARKRVQWDPATAPTDGWLTLLADETECGAATRAGHTMYRLTAINDTRFSVQSVDCCHVVLLNLTSDFSIVCDR